MNKLDLLRYIIREAIADLKRPKIIFLSGSPGSGKSTVVRLLGLNDFETIDPDKYYEQHLVSNKIPLNIAKLEEDYFAIYEQMKAAIEAGDEEEIARLKPEYNRQRKIIVLNGVGFTAGLRQAKEKRLALSAEKHNFIIDGTGGDYKAVSKLKLSLEKDGYDTAMIFVDAPLEIALQRNQARGEAGGRKLRDKTVEKSWTLTHSNLERYEQLFGDTFFYVDAADMENSVAEIKPLVNRFKSL